LEEKTLTVDWKIEGRVRESSALRRLVWDEKKKRKTEEREISSP
jgi:hypothetical protein